MIQIEMDPYAMSKRDNETLRHNRMKLLANVDPTTELLDYLWSKRILTDDKKEEIVQSWRTRKQKVSHLLDFLPRCGPNAFREFVFGLLESEQSNAARMLDLDLVIEWENGQHSQSVPQPNQPPSLPLEESQGPPSDPQLSKPEDETSQAQPVAPPDLQLSGPSEESVGEGSSSESEVSGPEDETDQNNTHKSIMDISMKQINLKDPNVLKMINSKDVYQMRSKPRGRALIINNTYFTRGRRREGGEHDLTNLHNLFTKLGFVVNSESDLTADQIRYLVKEESQHPDHQTADCFVLFVLSHGSHGDVYGMDAKPVSIKSDIMSQFDGEHCRALVGKPKLIFIQACQGDSATSGDTERQLQADDVDVSDLDLAVDNLNLQDTDDIVSSLTPHKMSDNVLAYSTVPGYKSWRHPELGSWFVRAMVDVFSADAHKDDLISMLIKVRRLIDDDTKYHRDGSFQQLTRTDETTKKKLFFFPGYYDT